MVIVSTPGSRGGRISGNALVRVEHGGSYVLVASHGGADEHPTWYDDPRDHPVSACGNRLCVPGRWSMVGDRLHRPEKPWPGAEISGG